MGEIGRTQNALGGSLFYYSETARWNRAGVFCLRNGQTALAGAQYFHAATEFSSAATQFNLAAGESKMGHNALEHGLGTPPADQDIHDWSQGAEGILEGYVTIANTLSSEATSIASLPPQAVAIAAARAQACLGRAELAIAEAEEFAGTMQSNIHGLEDHKRSL